MFSEIDLNIKEVKIVFRFTLIDKRADVDLKTETRKKITSLQTYAFLTTEEIEIRANRRKLSMICLGELKHLSVG